MGRKPAIGEDFRLRKIAEGVPITKDSSKYTFTDAAQLVIDNYIRKERRSIGDMQRRLDKHLL